MADLIHASSTNNHLPHDHETPTSHLADLLKHPDDLDRLPLLKAEFTRKKAAVDAQLKHGLSEQLSVTQSGMTAITDGSKSVSLIKEEMLKIDRLCSEAQGMIKDFPEIEKLGLMQRNFAAVEAMKDSIDTFSERLEELEGLLREDDDEPDVQSNLLAVHKGLTELRDVRDAAMEQVSRGPEGESGLELIENLPLAGGGTGEGGGGGTLREWFTKLDDVVDWFDEHVGSACLNIINLVQAGNNGLVVRLAIVIEEEEKKDKQVKALQDAQREFQDVASRFKSIAVAQRSLRGYKGKFLEALKYSAAAQFEGVKEAFAEDPERLEKSLRWYFNDLNTVKLGVVELVPKKWRIMRTYTNIYHQLMHDFLTERLDDENISPVHMLAILNWVPKYYSKMKRLGVEETELKPHVIDERESDLVREYRGLITKAVEEWMARIESADTRAFSSREEGSLDQDADGHLHTKSLGDVWTMLREQLAVAEASGRADVVEGVVDAMYRALQSRQRMYQTLLDREFQKIENLAATAPNPSDIEGLSSYQDWLVAIANDQITNIDDAPQDGITSFLTRFKQSYEPLVSPSYPLTSAQQHHDQLTNSYVDLSTHCLHLFARLLFTTDFRNVLKTFFVPPTWYQERSMQQITTTFDDYLSGENNIMQVLHPSLQPILVEELAETLLTSYLASVHTRGAKIRLRLDPYTEKIKDDVVTVFQFFQGYPESFEGIKDKWRVVNDFQNLLSADKNAAAAGGGGGAVGIGTTGAGAGGPIVEAFAALKAKYWDVQLSWVEAVLRCRDDFDRGMLSAVKSAAANLEVERGMETVMSKIK
ncbi:exocyst complex component Sec6 [Hortaea werneckii]|nr:exocyst complex component Sec6 [Hortaea werneckii]